MWWLGSTRVGVFGVGVFGDLGSLGYCGVWKLDCWGVWGVREFEECCFLKGVWELGGLGVGRFGSWGIGEGGAGELGN